MTMASTMIPAARRLLFASSSMCRQTNVISTRACISAKDPIRVLRPAFSSKPTDDTHDDFKPVSHHSPSDVRSTIESDVSKNKVFVYMKGVPAAPMCGFSMTVCRILDYYGAEYGSRNVLEDEDIRQGIKDFTSWPTIPQVFIDGEFVGGCDIMINMHEEGELAAALGVEGKGK